MKEYTSRVEAASAALQTTPATILEALKSLGIIEKTAGWLNDESIFTFGDFRQSLPAGFAIAPIRAAFAALRGNQSEKKRTEVADALGIEKTIDTVETEELLRHYDPAKSKSPITQELKKRLENNALIFFHPDNGVAIEETMQLINDYEQGLIHALPQYIEIDGREVESVVVGFRDDTVLEEDPMFPGHALRNGRSSINNRNYKSMNLGIRQFIRLLVDARQVDPEKPTESLAVMQMAKNLADLKESYPDVAHEFRRLERLKNLPPLTILRSSLKKASRGRVKSPFAIDR